MSTARAEEYTSAPAERDAGTVHELYPAGSSVVVELTRPIVGRSLTLEAGTRLVATHRAPCGRWVVLWHGSPIRAHARLVSVKKS